MNTDRELMQQALEALDCIHSPLHVREINKVGAAMKSLRERLAQPEQEPFCFHDGRNIVGKEYADHSDVFPLYTAPPPRQWQGLTDATLWGMWIESPSDVLRFARAIEAAHGIG